MSGARASDEAFLTALLAEGETSLQTIVERLGVAPVQAVAVDSRQFEDFADVLRERMLRSRNGVGVPRPAARPVLALVSEDAPLPPTLAEIDREIVDRCRELARRNLEIGRLFSSLVASQGWRALGYASLAQYSTDRVGLSLSSLEHRALLARRVARYTRLGKAIEEGLIGYEAALLVTHVIGRWASDDLVDAWIKRARLRTVKHLREEVRAVLPVVELDSEASRFPPSETDLEAVFELERKVQSGELLRAVVSQMSVTLAPEENGDAASSGANMAARRNRSNLRYPRNSMNIG